MNDSELITFALGAEGLGFWAGIDWSQATVELIGSFIVAIVAGCIAGYIAGQISGRKLVRFQVEHRQVRDDIPLLETIHDNLKEIREHVAKRQELCTQFKEKTATLEGRELKEWLQRSGWRVADFVTSDSRNRLHREIKKLRANSHIEIKHSLQRFYKNSDSVNELDEIVGSIERIFDKERGPDWRKPETSSDHS